MKCIFFVLLALPVIQCQRERGLWLPSVWTGEITILNPHTVICTGRVIDFGGDEFTARGIEWTTTAHANSFENEMYLPRNLRDTFSIKWYGLMPGTVYYVKAFATNKAGKAYGEIKQFTTPDQNSGSFTDERDGINYNWVEIGSQIWMAENLAYMPYVVPLDSQDGIWVYGNHSHDLDKVKASTLYNTYGCLYDWETACRVCPDGWHLPSEEEWFELESYLGIEEACTYLKESGHLHWFCHERDTTDCISGTNVTGFTALPGGERILYLGPNYLADGVIDRYEVTYYFIGELAGFWSSTECRTWTSSTTHATAYVLTYKGNVIWEVCPRKEEGHSVRCVKDL
jgi:uncharacterized protein (TIGR02145 family)